MSKNSYTPVFQWGESRLALAGRQACSTSQLRVSGGGKGDETLTTCPSSLPTILAFTVLNGSSGKVSISSPRIHQPNPHLSPSENPLISANSLSTQVSDPTELPPPQAPNLVIDPHSPSHQLLHQLPHQRHPITTHADCKSMNLIYQLQCTECNAFYIGETRRSLSDRMNEHRFTTTVSNPDLPVAIHIQSHQISFQECWSVSVTQTTRLHPRPHLPPI